MTNYYVGIDIAKKKHDINILSAQNRKPIKQFQISNDTFSFNLLIEKCKQIETNLNNFVFCCEATGIYHINICNYLHSKKLKVNVVNPVLIKNFKLVDNIRNTKNDQIDSLAIAEYASYKQVQSNYEERTHHEQLRSLTRFKSTIVDKTVADKVRIRALLDKNIPEFSDLFPNISSSTCLYLLLSTDNLFNILKREKNQLNEMISKKSHGKFKMAFTEKLIHSLKSSRHNSHNISDMLEIRMLANEVNFHIEQLKTINESIDTLMASIDTPICTIPGINQNLGAQIIAEIGDISNFNNPKQLVAYAGIDPRIQQSGNYELKNGRMNKKGSKYLRKALFQAAQVIYRHDEYFGNKYQELKERGKHHFVCVNAIARKLLHIIWAMETKKISYDPTFLQN